MLESQLGKRNRLALGNEFVAEGYDLKDSRPKHELDLHGTRGQEKESVHLVTFWDSAQCFHSNVQEIDRRPSW